MSSTVSLQIRVGLLILISLGIFSVTVFLMGKERRLFENRVPFEVHFSRTNGLRQGSPVHLRGVPVGSVEDLGFPKEIREKFIVVRIRVAGEMAPRIRQDTVARIRTMGLLGDKYVELFGGSSASDPLLPGGIIASVDPVDYETLLGEGGDMFQDFMKNFIEVSNSLKVILKSVEEGKGFLGQLIAEDRHGHWSETGRNLRDASASLRAILQSVEKGEGLLGQLVTNREAGERAFRDLQAGLAHLRDAAASFQTVGEKLERGEGTLGTLIQDPSAGREILLLLRRSAANLEAVTRELQDGDGLLQRLVRDRSYAERVLGNLEATTADLAGIVGKIEKGEGTLGALVNDPALYRDARGMLREAKRSWLYSLYRFFKGLGASEKDSASGGEIGEAGGSID